MSKINKIIKSIFKEKLSVIFSENKINIPQIGDVLELNYLHLVKPSGKGTLISFRSRGFIGLCISVRKAGLLTKFVLRNVLKKQPIEFSFFIFSPLFERLRTFVQKKGRYRSSKLFFLRKKALHYSKIRLLKVLKYK